MRVIRSFLFHFSSFCAFKKLFNPTLTNTIFREGSEALALTSNLILCLQATINPLTLTYTISSRGFWGHLFFISFCVIWQQFQPLTLTDTAYYWVIRPRDTSWHSCVCHDVTLQLNCIQHLSSLYVKSPHLKPSTALMHSKLIIDN